jgi:tetratricopeptide (TPR) repeat protein
MPMLEEAARNDPDDIDVQEGKAYVLGLRGQKRAALAIYEANLAKAPERLYSRENAARTAAEIGDVPTAVNHLRELLKINPWGPGWHYLLAKLLGQQGDWSGAVAESQASLKLDPTSIPARMLLVAGYLQSDKKEEARKEFSVLERLQPPELERLRAWFNEQTR